MRIACVRDFCREGDKDGCTARIGVAVCLGLVFHAAIVDSAGSDEAKAKDAAGETFALKLDEITDFEQSFVGMARGFVRRERTRPTQLKGTPEGLLGSVYYFAADLGKRKLLMAMASVDPPKLYADTDFDNDLSDEKAFEGKIQKPNPKGPSFRRRQTVFQFGPIPLARRDDEKGQRTKIVVRWYRGQSYVYLFPTEFRTGKVRLGKRSCKVVLIDGDLDGRYNSVFAGMSPSGQRTPRPDFLGIDLDQNGEFANSGMDSWEQRPLTRMIELDGRYYNLTASPDGAKLRIAKATPKMGTLAMQDRDLQALLMCDSGYVCIRGSEGKMNVPVGKYRAVYGFLSRTDEEGAKWTLTCGRGMGKLTDFEVREGQVLKFNAGAPIALKADVRKRGSTVSIGFSAVGQAGENYAGGAQKDGKRPPPPKLKILDEKGKVLSQGTFEYG